MASSNTNQTAEPMDQDVVEDVAVVDEEEEEYTVEAILDKRKEAGQTQYFIKWEGYDSDANSWEPIDNLNCASLIAEFEENLANKKRAKRQSIQSRRRSRNIANGGPSNEASRNYTDSSDTEDNEVEEIVQKRSTKSRKPLEKVPEKEPPPPVKDAPKGFARNQDMDDILGCCFDEEDKLYFIVRWKNRVENQVEMIPVEDLEEYAPKELCAWYRRRLYHCAKSPGDKDVMDIFKVLGSDK